MKCTVFSKVMTMAYVVLCNLMKMSFCDITTANLIVSAGYFDDLMRIAMECDEEVNPPSIPGTLTDMYRESSQADESEICEQYYRRFNQ